jgi:hypothetical protein
MTKDYWISKIAAGLRRMDKKPDFLLLSDPPYWFSEICGIPTINTSLGVTSGYDGEIFCIYPCWNDDGDYSRDVYFFQREYKEYR